jgi:tetratricopeptide (TPR) repeat protein
MKPASRVQNAAFLLFLLFGAMPLWAESSLDVKCVDASGNPVANATLRLQHFNSGKGRDKKSDGKGKADFTKLEDGLYRIVGRKEGFEPAFQDFVGLKGSTETVTLTFKPGNMQTQVYFENQAAQQKAFEILGEAIKAIQASKFAEAEKQINEAIVLNPANPDAYFNLAMALYQQQKWDAGNEALKKAGDIAALLAELPWRGTEANPYVEMKTRIQTVAQKIPGFKLRADADKALAAKKFDEAAALYQKALEAEKDADIYYNLSIALGNARKYDQAIEAIDQAIKAKPQETSYQELRKRIMDNKQNEVLIRGQGAMEAANKLFDSGDYAGALKGYEAILATIPEKNQAAVWFQVARAHGQLKQQEKAVDAFKKAMALAPQNAEYRRVLAQYYLSEKLFQQALDLYSDPASAGSQPVDQTLFALGEKLSSQGNSEVAQLAFERVLQANPQHPEAHYELGMLLYYGKKADKRASELLTKYVEIGKEKAHVDNAKTVLVVLKKRMSAPAKPAAK